MKTIHIILNAHIDPIWLWPWQAGLDSALATCRSACDRLDAHKDIYFTRGEAWIYNQIQLIDPPLFRRIRKHVDSGRWSVVGGWWIQPDCNLPSGFAMKRQIELGRQYFTKNFKRFPITAYNVDSFGHSAVLPQLMHDAGQSRYVMMRPQSHEMKLPARLFRWRGHEGGPLITTFRISDAYVTHAIEVAEHVLKSTTQLPPGIEHTMCFIGVGDHGGGPTDAQINYLKEHRGGFGEWKLEFSTVDRFFDAITPQLKSLPVVTGELQHHAVGCYTVHRPVKVGVRRAEHLLAQAERIVEHSHLRPQAGTAGQLRQAWSDVCFHHFHDTLGGTCIPSAYVQVNDQLGRARAIADEVMQQTFRRMLGKLGPDRLQRMALFNASDEPFDGYIQLEPWMEYLHMSPTARLLDESGNSIPFQFVQSEPLVKGSDTGAIAFRVRLEANAMRVLRIDQTAKAKIETSPVDVQVKGAALRVGEIACDDMLRFADGPLATPHLELVDDLSDTWAHGVERFSDTAVNFPKFSVPTITAKGPLIGESLTDGQIGSSRLRMRWRVCKDDPFIELRLMVVFAGRHKMLKLVLPLPSAAQHRDDGIMTGHLRRENDGIERPIHDWTRINLNNGKRLAVIAPDCFALDCTPNLLRLSLIRSPRMAHHIPYKPTETRGIYADQGRHEFRFFIRLAKSIDTDELHRRALMAHRPLLFADVTAGMPARH